MNDENAWIDEIIMKHKNQLKVLKDSNNEITNINSNTTKSLNNFQIINSIKVILQIQLIYILN